MVWYGAMTNQRACLAKIDLLGVISTDNETKPRCAVAIGEHAIDLVKYAQSGKLDSLESGHNFKYENVFAEVSSVK